MERKGILQPRIKSQTLSMSVPWAVTFTSASQHFSLRLCRQAKEGQCYIFPLPLVG